MAIAPGAVSQGTTTGTSLTISHVISGSDTILVVGVWNTGGDIITGATYNGVAMTLVDKIQRGDSTGRWGYLFYLVAPADGTHNIVISASGSTTFFGYGASYTGVLQTGQPDNHGTNTANDTSLYKTLASVANNCWHTGLFFNKAQAASAGTATTARSVSVTSGDGIYDSNGPKTPAGNTTIGITVPSTDQLACCTITMVPVKTPTGGTKYTDGSYTIHKFLLANSGTSMDFGNAGNVQVLVQAGGGGGGANYGGGGGAGGVLYNASLAVTAQAYTVTVGGGGNGGGTTTVGSDGQNSVFSSLTAVGGGGGGNAVTPTGRNGGSGGGGGGTTGTGGTATSGQGNNGGHAAAYGGAGGGGAGAVGGDSTAGTGGPGGDGVSTYSDLLIAASLGVDISGVHWIAGGGAGATDSGGGGKGGGGSFETPNATANTGSGGGRYTGTGSAGNGAAGFVLIRYLTSSFTGASPVKALAALGVG